ncbi:MAG: dTDP-4-dehydrorhamnose 3,5-epimerase [Gallionella sp.]|nr:dTDP-4-dehydrorhamnose 3,5-epimerase [Gallionella sp.]
MIAIATKLSGLKILEPKVHSDHRGYFFESFNQRVFNELVGAQVNFVQDNHSHSKKHVVRGLHYQYPLAQGKLVRVAQGRVLNVSVDIRRSSPTFSQHISVELSAENKRMVWIPPGFAHGFVALSDTADVLYKATKYWHQEQQHSLLWNDPELAIDWQLSGYRPTLSSADTNAKPLAEAELFD